MFTLGQNGREQAPTWRCVSARGVGGACATVAAPGGRPGALKACLRVVWLRRLMLLRAAGNTTQGVVRWWERLRRLWTGLLTAL